MMVDLKTLDRDGLEALAQAVEDEIASRTAEWETAQRLEWAVGELERLAALKGAIPAEPVPADGFMPGQIVDMGSDTLWLNTSGTYVHTLPGAEPTAPWQAIEEPPEPGEPEPDPDDEPEPEIPAWQQPTGAHDTYPIGAIVTHQGHLWENTYDNNAWEPGTPHSQWTDLGPVT